MQETAFGREDNGLVTGVLIGFAIIAAVIAIGYIVGRTEVLGEHAPFVLSRLAFFVLSPCLLFTVLADADVHQLFSSVLAVSAIAAVVSILLFAAVAVLLWRRSISDTVIGSLASGYVNANNIGIPVAAYVLGDAAFSAPVILLQLLVLAPIALTILDVQDRGRASIRHILLGPLTNPIIIGSVLGRGRGGQRRRAARGAVRAVQADRRGGRAGRAAVVRHVAARAAPAAGGHEPT